MLAFQLQELNFQKSLQVSIVKGAPKSGVFNMCMLSDTYLRVKQKLEQTTCLLSWNA